MSAKQQEMDDSDAEILAAAREGFIVEAREQLQAFESALLVMETHPEDDENLNAAFRAAHTIKGTAGLFGCDAVAAFTHEVETLMEELRSGRLRVDGDIAAVLLEGMDQIGALLDEINLAQGAPEVAARSVALGQRLRALAGGPAGAAQAGALPKSNAGAGTSAVPAVSAAPASPSSASTPAAATAWHLSLRFGTDALRNGLDPLAFIRYLGGLGRMAALRTLADQVPALEALDAESCHLGFELRFDTSAHPGTDRTAIEQVFEFARDDAAIAILEPGAEPAAYAALLAERCGNDAEAAEALRQIWREMGVPFESRGGPAAAAPAKEASAAAAHAAPAAATPAKATPAPTAERRAAGSERRDSTPDRRNAGSDEARFVRVRADKLDRLIDIIGELVIAGSGVQTAALAEAAPLAQEAAQRVCDLVEDARDGALALRMVPVGETFARFHRVVRDVSKSLGKEVELVITGGDAELDKSMVDVIGDPLTHLVRNSLDHGIEGPEDRLAAGKPAKGKLALHAYHEAGAIVIEVSDDGRGLTRERILGKAVERGLVAADAVLSDAEVWQLIFAPGFSTAEQVTSVSGRGVGMDVVKRNVEALRGQISIASTPGQGTTMQLRLPLTLAIIDGFLTQVGKVHYVIPLAVVAECIDLPAECRFEAKPGNPASAPAKAPVSGTFSLRGDVLPWLDLARWYGHAEADAARPARRSLVVVRNGSQRVGLVVDRLLGEHQTVIKPLAGIFGPLKALAGSTILGSGDVALVLDMPGLVNAAVHSARAVGTVSARQPQPRASAPPLALSPH